MHIPTERLIVLMENDCIHTTAHPRCADSDCPCQQDAHVLLSQADRTRLHGHAKEQQQRLEHQTHQRTARAPGR
jgi:hypothetical protein